MMLELWITFVDNFCAVGLLLWTSLSAVFERENPSPGYPKLSTTSHYRFPQVMHYINLLIYMRNIRLSTDFANTYYKLLLS